MSEYGWGWGWDPCDDDWRPPAGRGARPGGGPRDRDDDCDRYEWRHCW